MVEECLGRESMSFVGWHIIVEGVNFKRMGNTSTSFDFGRTSARINLRETYRNIVS